MTPPARFCLRLTDKRHLKRHFMSSHLKHPERSHLRRFRRVPERLSSSRAFSRSLVFSHTGSLLTHTHLFLQLPLLLQLLQGSPPQTFQVCDQMKETEERWRRRRQHQCNQLLQLLLYLQ